jgi:hypothetical protein
MLAVVFGGNSLVRVQVYTLLVAAARDAATVAGEHTEAAMNGKVPLIVPEFRTFIMPAVVKALDEWRAEAEKSEWYNLTVAASLLPPPPGAAMKWHSSAPLALSSPRGVPC